MERPTGYIPFYTELTKLAKLDTRFFVPGHKGRGDSLPFLGDAATFDLTEIEGACDLQHPEGPLAESEALMAAVYGAGRTLYSAAGSTSCILAMLHLHTGPGRPVILARGCHAAAVRSLCFTGAAPVWLQPDETGQLPPAQLAAALKQHPGAPVYVTSPDYYGQMQDIRTLAETCHAHGSKLLVDNAHGAYLRFFTPDLHPITLGADAACDSAHKTLPCLTPGALLHLRAANDTTAAAARRALNLYSSTSPSYLVLANLAYLAGLLSQCPPDFAAAAKKLHEAVERAGARHLVRTSGDALRLCLDPARAALPTAPLEAALAEAGILPEYADGRCVVLMAAPGNSDADFGKLEAALAKFCAANPISSTALPAAAPLPPPLPLPKAVCLPRQAFFAETQAVPIAAAVGRVAAFIEAPCPPGVPLVLPGEEVTAAAAARYASAGISAVDVVK